MLIGYARTSTLEQQAGLASQMAQLESIGCGKIFSEQTSSVGARQQLASALAFIREGDTLVVTQLDRLARSVIHLGKIVQTLKDKGVELRILNLSVDTNTPTGKLILNVIGSVAQFEREMMLERQREGIAKAKREGRYKGRAPTARRKRSQILALKSMGRSIAEIVTETGVSRASVYRLLREDTPALAKQR